MMDGSRLYLFLKGWIYSGGDKRALRRGATTVTVDKYLPEMKGSIFCPECCVGVFRYPETGSHDRSGRKAYFSHARKDSPECGLRAKKTLVRRFESRELASQSIEDGSLVVVKEFVKEKPELVSGKGLSQCEGGVMEAPDGGLVEVPIGKRKGESFNLPSKLTTVRAICWGFDNNLYRYFYLPGEKRAVRLLDLLIDIKGLRGVDGERKLYFGKIKSSEKHTYTRVTMLEYTGDKDFNDFCFKAEDSESREHGVGDDSVGKTLVMYGVITKRGGTGLCIKDVGWGEYAVLPSKYDHLLESFRQVPSGGLKRRVVR